MHLLPRDPRGGSSHSHSHGSDGGGGGGGGSSSSANTATYALDVFCAYAVSGPYDVIPRALFYVLIFLSFFSRTALTTLMLYTSIAAIHVSALASHHSLEVIDLDIFPAYNATIMAMLYAPLLIMLAAPLRGEGRKNLGVVALWMILLWTGIVSFCATQKYQPSTVPCLDSHGHNVTSNANITSCAHHLTCAAGPRLPMRSGQLPQVVSKPGDFYAGPHHTQHWIIAITVLITAYMFVGFGVAVTPPTSSAPAPTRTRKSKKKAKDEASVRLLVFKVGFWGGIMQILFMEIAIHHFPVVEGRDVVGQWGVLVGFALAMVGVLVRMVPEMELGGGGRPRKGVAEVGTNALNGGGYRVKDGEGGKGDKVGKVGKADKADEMGKEGVESEGLDMSAVRRPDEVHLKSKSEVALSTPDKGADDEGAKALERRGTF
jgi:hypothetical protein